MNPMNQKNGFIEKDETIHSEKTQMLKKDETRQLQILLIHWIR